MKRRDFLGASAAGASLLALDIAPSLAQNNAPQNANAANRPFTAPKRSPLYTDGKWQQPARAIRGVNLGAWLVLEKWMSPSLFANTEASDEYSLSQIPGGRERIEHHRETWISEADFRWIAEYGLDAVRIPIGFWTLQEAKPYLGAARHLQNAFDWAQKYDLKVLLDLHGAQGSQNGWEHSGRSGEIGWTKPENRAASLQTLSMLADKYGAHPNLWGLELLNEPRYDVSLDILREFYTSAYKTLRPKLPASVAIVIHDAFRAGAWQGFAPAPEFSNVVLDTHLYQTFTESDSKRTPLEQVQFALNRREEIERLKSGPWLIVGEWSLTLPWGAMKTQTPLQRDATRLAYAGAQLLCFETSHGWFYWSYKTESGGEWSFRDCVKQGWMPASMTI
ncbi:glucan 1,3-beta-glucosidase [Abditibacterium utsteinense]|uniref:Exo-1,3-beta-glucanase D n=1 Tax=Abditibacterium utsteinense TaxID=1960156 RepID=A0A2S8SU61_9BACT|nr:glycoside hydrolase family 5 protein [Abditibacterium utsteinense]PQV64318.1 glucan 1,3-beta-glucosidase [Abditibacterium utsteinense]